MADITLTDYIVKRNVRAFLWALRYGEGTQGEDGYRTLFGGRLFLGVDGIYSTFDDFADHPRIRTTVTLKNGKRLTSTAAGAYQILERTWDGVCNQYGFLNFEPPTQDLAAIALIAGRGGLEDVVEGRIHIAVLKCNKEWASLPGSPYGQPVVTLEDFRREYEEAGGLYLNEETQPVPTTPLPVTATEMKPKLPHIASRTASITTGSTDLGVEFQREKAMPIPAVVAALLPSLIQLVPQLTKIFGSGSEVSQRNIAAAEAVFTVAKDAIGAKNEQEVIEAIKADPVQATAVKQAIEKNYLQIQEAGGGGIAAARDYSLTVAQMRTPEGQPLSLLTQPAFVISIVMLGLVVMMVLVVLFPWEILRENGGQIYTDEVRLIVVTAIIGSLSTIGAFWLGSSFASRGNVASGSRTRSTD
jgi:muramidase (phage lysozyme)